ncbi:hypothetical protein [Desulfurobacterium sp.]|uniref:hypothetical protein n=1 Tax=Desulfurobacterium sp. TaxID=2004706 RepID=UPI00262164EA|nr:hypothetical protein [Desulfurobacterium sp.]
MEVEKIKSAIKKSIIRALVIGSIVSGLFFAVGMWQANKVLNRSYQLTINHNGQEVKFLLVDYGEVAVLKTPGGIYDCEKENGRYKCSVAKNQMGKSFLLIDIQGRKVWFLIKPNVKNIEADCLSANLYYSKELNACISKPDLILEVKKIKS